jgi:signal transduction histidine kinase
LSLVYNSYLFSVCDKGQGISKEDLPLIFEKFHRGKNSQQSGLGLGMFICKEIIEAHQGEIKLTSHLNKGTKVYIYLPTNY